LLAAAARTIAQSRRRIVSRRGRTPWRTDSWSEAKPVLRVASGDIIDVDTLLTNHPQD
jgi:hypothetical protein